MKISIDVKLLASWLKDNKTNNLNSNAVLDGLEDLFLLETELAKEFQS